MKKLKLKTDIQRTDSFQVMSNIRIYSRTQLLVETLIRLYRILSDGDKQKFKGTLSPYVEQTSGAFIYGLKKTDIPHEQQKIASVYHQLHQELKQQYGDTEIFRIFDRVYNEHFCMVSDKIAIRDVKEISSSSLQSPDDIDATFRNKRSKNYQGQVVNVTETANPENALNLLTDVTVAPNNTDDSTILNGRLDIIKDKCPDINELHTDGAYGSSANDRKINEHTINHIQTAVRGRTPAVDISIEPITPEQHNVSCPLQSTVSEKTKTRFKASFDMSICTCCPHSESCPSVVQNDCRAYYFT